jgi:hypothetical protein
MQHHYAEARLQLVGDERMWHPVGTPASTLRNP